MWKKLIKPILEWFGHFETVQSIIHTEFIRTAFLPTVSAMVTGASGVAGGVPIMWIIMATALVFMAVMQALLRGDELRERKTPLNKLSFLQVQFSCDLAPATMLFPPAGNRQQRRTQSTQAVMQTELSSNTIVPGVARNLAKGQLAVVLRNSATFPISCILQNAETEVATLKPPRSSFPKKPSIIQAGGVFAIPDEVIDMKNQPCGRLAGKLNMLIKYGLPGKEIFDLRLVGDIDIIMESFGLVNQVNIAWHSTHLVDA